MAITTLSIDAPVLGAVLFLKHQRTQMKQPERKVPEFEVYSMMSEIHGEIDVYVPANVRRLKPKYEREVLLIDPYLKMRSNVMTIDKKKRASVEYVLHVASFELVGGQQ